MFRRKRADILFDVISLRWHEGAGCTISVDIRHGLFSYGLGWSENQHFQHALAPIAPVFDSTTYLSVIETDAKGGSRAQA